MNMKLVEVDERRKVISPKVLCLVNSSSAWWIHPKK